MKRFYLLSLSSLIFVTGCVCVPTESVTGPITNDELVQHVEFLTQPALRGRAAGSRQSAYVQHYLTERLEQYGCVPWGNNPSFKLDFGFGTNVIGVLPGSDPELADEIVLVSAHYDHLPPKWFTYYPGACDNAAAVAVLLELAEQISRMEQRPRRTICFAFFDAEEKMCLGSFAFTCRQDYDDAAIAAVVNMDLMGRDLLDVVDRSLVVTGTEQYADIETQVAAACSQNDLRFIAMEADLIGPVGDHIAFTSSQRPVLFFSSGIYKDYHEPTDTADKLNFNKLRLESSVVESTVLSLAGADASLFARMPAPISHQRADSFVYLIGQFKQHQDMFKLDPNDVKTLDEILAAAKEFDPNTMTRAELVNLERESLAKLIGMMNNYNKTLAQYSNGFLDMSRFYAINPEGMTEVCREIVRHFLSHRPSLFSNNDFTYRSALPVTDKSWGLNKIGEEEYFFGFFDAEVTFQFKASLLRGMSFQGGINHKLTAFKGPLHSIIETVFLGKPSDPNGFEGVVSGYFGPVEQKPKTDSPYILSERQQCLWHALAAKVRQTFPEDITALTLDRAQDPNGSMENWLTTSQSQEGMWSIFLTPGDVSQVVEHDDTGMEQWAIQTVTDCSKHVETRTDAIDLLIFRKSNAALTVVADIIDDKTPYTPEPSLFLDKKYPLRYHPIVSQHISQQEEKDKKYHGKTLGQIALEKLKKLTHKDFGGDKEVWKKWIEKHYTSK